MTQDRLSGQRHNRSIAAIVGRSPKSVRDHEVCPYCATPITRSYDGAIYTHGPRDGQRCDASDRIL